MDIATVITIDGPSGSGKGTLCKALAEFLGWHVLDSGAIYRLLALAALDHQIDITSEAALVQLVTHLDFCFYPHNGKLLMVLEGKDVTNKIRTETVSKIASQVAKLPKVRKALVYIQRAFRAEPGLVADGRDMGTIVFPDAKIKIFLDANLEERGKRRRLQLQERGFNVNFKWLVAEMRTRDNRDRNRDVSPLVPASDAFILDSSSLSMREVIQQALWYVKKFIAF